MTTWRGRVLGFVAAVLAVPIVLVAAPTPAAADVTPGPGRFAIGGSHRCAVDQSGGVRCWGSDSSGQLGDGGTNTTRDLPTPVVGLTDVVAVDAGNLHTCALTASGGVYCWGSDSSGQIGNGPATSASQPTPVPVTGLGGPAVAIDLGRSHSCALLDTGAVRCWGRNNERQILNTSTSTFPAPVDVVLPASATAIAAGNEHTCAVDGDGTVLCWGRNTRGQLGTGAGTGTFPPAAVALQSGLPAVAIEAGWEHTCAIDAAGGIECWGKNDQGQLGDRSRDDRPTPVRVSDASTGFVHVAPGNTHTCAVDDDGAAFCWGDNLVGQLGLGFGAFRRLRPTPVAGHASGTAVIETTEFYTCSISTQWRVRCWGLPPFTGSEASGMTDIPGFGGCPLLVPNPNTSYTLSEGFLVGSVATFSAHPPFSLLGPPTRTCQPGDVWSAPPPFAIPTVSIGTTTVLEGNSGTTIAQVPVTLSNPTPGTVTVSWQTTTTGSTAAAGSDYTAASGTLTIPPGEIQGAIPVEIRGDLLDEQNEGVIVTITSPLNALITSMTSAIGGVTITDDDQSAVVPGVSSVVEGDSGTTLAQLSVVLSNPSTRQITVKWAALFVGPNPPPDQATMLEDYDISSGTVTFPAGTTQAFVTVPVHGDTLDENDEWIAVSFYEPTNAIMGGFYGLGFIGIVDDDNPPIV